MDRELRVFSGFSTRWGGQISILKIIGGGWGHHFFSLYVQVSLNFLLSMHITTATSISIEAPENSVTVTYKILWMCGTEKIEE